jgi:hypothetical protein
MRKWILTVIIIAAMVVHLVVVMPSGSHYCQEEICGLYFWGAHEHDGVWHLALINNALSVFPARFPTFSGALLTGYNALLDWSLLALHWLTRIPVMTLYFKIVPILWFGSMIWVWTKFSKIYSKNTWFTITIIFFAFFGNSFSYIFRLFHEGIIWGASGLLSMQSPHMLNNIQFALTLPLLGLMMILFMKQMGGWKDFLVLGFLNFMMMGLKFYGGIIGLVMSGVYGLTLIYQKKWRQGIYSIIVTFIGFGLATLLFYKPFDNIGGPSILNFRPLATVHPIIEEAGLFFAPSIANLRNNLYATNVSWRLVLIEVATLSIFIIFNWGTRIIGLWGIKKRTIDLILLSGIFTGLIMNILFTQRGEWWNTVQFLYYSTFLSNIYAADVLAKLIQNGRVLALSATILIVVLTIPNAIDTYRIFSSFPPHSYISDTEMKALEHLKALPSGIVLALPISPIPGNEYQLPRPLYNMYDTAYVAAFSGQQTYLNDLVQLRLTGIDYEERLKSVKTAKCDVLGEIKYFYIAGDQSQLIPWQKCQGKNIKEIYVNDEASIYLVTTDTPNQ